MPKREIPEWFDHVNKGGFPEFTARRKFPALALALVFGEVDAIADREIMEGRWRTVGMHLFIQGKRRRYHNFSVAENHVLLCDLRVLFSLEKWEDVGFGVDEDWKTLRVSCETNLSLCSWGVYVYKTETNMDDINFNSQHPSSSLVWSDDELISDMDKIVSKTRSLNLPEMHREYRMWSTGSRKRAYFKGESSRGLEKASRRVMALRRVEGKSGMNIEDEKDKDLDAMLVVLGTAELDKHFHYPNSHTAESFTSKYCCIL